MLVVDIVIHTWLKYGVFLGYTIQGGFTKVVCYVLTKCIKMHPYLSNPINKGASRK